ncbi:hypothetical protein LWI29_017901 [Acer saccharum]|uniref:Uncharacterized protein n=1 Tax=Acer saccharum TaxID=4024 RepID=A0AA39VBG4_ACESA|nr:hypothetical protein LWI29_017901 [Acer saccharum]
MGPAVSQGEELLFGFWMRAPASAKKLRYWGRRREGSEGGNCTNWRSVARTVDDRGGGRFSEENFDRLRVHPNLAGDAKS